MHVDGVQAALASEPFGNDVLRSLKYWQIPAFVVALGIPVVYSNVLALFYNFFFL